MSDFGQEEIEKESKYGPQGIWKKPSTEDTSTDIDDAADYDDDEDEDDDDEDVHDKVRVVGSFSDSEDGEEEDESKNGDSSTREEFVRPSNAQGVVLHSELKRRHAKKLESDIDDIALRQYEKRRLKYYFAIAECDSTETSNSLYTELDGMEFEHSSMIFDLRFVPDDVCRCHNN